jgi:hypothetical protein
LHIARRCCFEEKERLLKEKEEKEKRLGEEKKRQEQEERKRKEREEAEAKAKARAEKERKEKEVNCFFILCILWDLRRDKNGFCQFFKNVKLYFFSYQSFLIFVKN